MADLYILLFNTILTYPEQTAHGKEGFYFGESGEHDMYTVGKTICDGMRVMGVPSDPEPSTFSAEELHKFFGVSNLAFLKRSSPH